MTNADAAVTAVFFLVAVVLVGGTIWMWIDDHLIERREDEARWRLWAAEDRAFGRSNRPSP